MRAASPRRGHDEHDAARSVLGAQGDVRLCIDGSKPLTMAAVEAVDTVCASVESDETAAVLAVHVSGVPGDGWADGLSLSLVTKWERCVRRLERLTVPTVAVAADDCGGIALDALLATDYRIAAPGIRLSLPVDGEAIWPGMAIFRLAQQGGGTRLRKAILFGTRIEAHEGLDLGVIDELADDPAKALVAMTELAGTLSGRELAIRRQLMFDAGNTVFEDALGLHLAACDRALRRSLHSAEQTTG